MGSSSTVYSLCIFIDVHGATVTVNVVVAVAVVSGQCACVHVCAIVSRQLLNWNDSNLWPKNWLFMNAEQDSKYMGQFSVCSWFILRIVKLKHKNKHIRFHSATRKYTIIDWNYGLELCQVVLYHRVVHKLRTVKRFGNFQKYNAQSICINVSTNQE